LIFVALAAAATAAMLLLASASRRWVLITAALVILAIPAIAWMQSAAIDQSLTQDSFGWRSVFVGDSAYHRIVVRQHGNAVRHLYFGDTRQSMMYLSDPHGEGMTYTSSFHLARLMRPSLKRVLLIGLGGGTAAKQFAHHYDDTIVDAVEVDPMVVDVAKRFFALQPNDRMRVHVVDGRLFLKRTTETWDLIVVDAYTTNRYGSTIPPHLTTREFLGDVASHLAPGGVLHFHCAYGATKLRPAMQKTIASVFASTLVSEGEIIASNVALITPKDVLTERLKSSRTARLSALPTYIRKLAPAPPPRADVPVLTDDYAPVDTLMREKI
jgi:spermidine synthase